jgi:hypothetical protein
MTDIDDRGQNAPRIDLDPLGQVVRRLKCPECGHVTLLTRKWHDELLKKLDPKMPAQRAIIECKCGKCQHILQARVMGR